LTTPLIYRTLNRTGFYREQSTYVQPHPTISLMQQPIVTHATTVVAWSVYVFV